MEFTGGLSVGVSQGAINDYFKAFGLSNQMNGWSGLLEAMFPHCTLQDLLFIPFCSLSHCLIQTPITLAKAPHCQSTHC